MVEVDIILVFITAVYIVLDGVVSIYMSKKRPEALTTPLANVGRAIRVLLGILLYINII